MSGVVAKPPSFEGTVIVQLGDREVVALVRRYRSGQTTRIRVGRELPLQVVLPAHAPEGAAEDALRAKETWVLGKLDRIDRATAESKTLGLMEPGTAWHFAQRLSLVERRVDYARREGEQLVIPEDAAVRGPALERWYRRTARAELRRLVQEEQARLGLHPRAVTIRDQRTRWGSCSPAGRISLNWRLLIGPEEVARYVVIHELCHLKIPNHSRAFWRSLAEACPEWEASSDWLAEYGDELRRFRPSSGLQPTAG